MSFNIFLLAFPALCGALVGWRFRIWSLIPAVGLSVAGAILVARILELTIVNAVFVSVSSALACQCGYVISSLARSNLCRQRQVRKPAEDTAEIR